MSKSKIKKSNKTRKTEEPEVLWFVLDCEKDDSVCLISEPHVIYGEDVKRGTKVKFFMSRGSEELVGTVDSFSGT